MSPGFQAWDSIGKVLTGGAPPWKVQVRGQDAKNPAAGAKGPPLLPCAAGGNVRRKAFSRVCFVCKVSRRARRLGGCP